MKADIHPDYHSITVVRVDGTEMPMKSTHGKKGDILKLDVDTSTHPAWTGGVGRVVERGQLDRFTKRFGSFGLSKTADE